VPGLSKHRHEQMGSAGMKLLIVGTLAGIIFFDVGTAAFKLWEFGIVLGSIVLSSRGRR
jgi:hypothetical protein